MAGTMQIYENRLASFTKKSKAKNAHKGWPHPKSFIANPESLANAGFFFKPSKEDVDNVQCFMCKKELDGWDENDNPFEIHLQKCPKCSWAIARCSIEFDVDESGNFVFTDDSRLPSNKTLERARLDTYGGKSKWWPHDVSKTHGATSKKMAAAGFVYTPQTEGDDTATCFYCDLTLSGWDEDDDPEEEHHKREAKSGTSCPFFRLEVDGSLAEQSKQKKKPARKSKAPKKAASGGDDDGDLEAAPVTVEPKATGASRKGKKSAKPSTTQILKDVEVDENLREDDDPSLKVQPEPSAKKPSKKKSAAKLKTPASSQSTAQDEDDEKDGGKPRPTTSQGSRKAAGAKKGKQKKEELKETVEPPTSPVDGKPPSRYQDFQVDIAEVEEARKGRSNTKTTGSRKQSRSKSKSRQSSKPPSSDKKESRPPSRTSSRPKVAEVLEIEDDVGLREEHARESPEPEPLPKPPSKAKPKPKRTKATTANSKQKVLDTGDEMFEPAPLVDASHERTRTSSRPELHDSNDRIKERPVTNTTGALEDEHALNSEKARQKGDLIFKRNERKPQSRGKAHSPTRVHTEPVKDDGGLTDTMDVDEGGFATADDHEFDNGQLIEADIEEQPNKLPTAAPLASFSKRQVGSVLTPKNLSQSRNSPFTSSLPKSRPTKLNPQSRSRSQTPVGSRGNSPSRLPVRVPNNDVSMRNDEHQFTWRDSGKENRSGIEAPRFAFSNSNPTPSTPVAPSTPERQILRMISPRPISPPPSHTPSLMSRDFSPSPPAQPRLSPVNEHDQDQDQEERRSPSPSFLPPLASTPRVLKKKLTAEERGLTVEQWIRREMEIECGLLRQDGERKIHAFRQRAEEIRREIEAL